MIYQNAENENTQEQFSNAIKELEPGKLLRSSNITKSCGVPAYKVFQFLLLLVFRGKTLFRFLDSRRKSQAVSKNTYYRFLNESSYNWKKFLLLLAARVTSAFRTLTRPERINVLVLDDSVGFDALSSVNQTNRYQEGSRQIDRRTNGYKRRKESMMKKPDAAILLIQNTLKVGIEADYVLMDSWFTTDPMIREILKTGLDTVGMVKQWKQRYTYQGKAYTLPQLQKFVRYENARDIFGSLIVTTKSGICVKIVFVRNRNKRSQCLYILSTDCGLSDAEVVRLYGNRWPIECFFKATKRP